jgi:sugar lactone lactonase YvrE
MQLLASGFAALEGPTVDADGSLLFSDLRAGGVHRLDATGRVGVVLAGRTGVGGICLHADGGIVVSGPDLCHVDDGRRRVLLELDDLARRPGRVAVAFNDLAADHGGRVFAGVLCQDAAGRPVHGELLWVTAEREHVVLHDEVHPNGIGLSPDGSRLYVADTFGRRLIVFDVAGDAPPEASRTIATGTVDGLPDGLAVDAAGDIWVAFYRGGCVVRFAPGGRVLQRVAVPALKPLSVCLTAGADPALYVVTATREPGSAETGCVYRMPVAAPAARSDRVRI